MFPQLWTLLGGNAFEIRLHAGLRILPDVQVEQAVVIHVIHIWAEQDLLVYLGLRRADLEPAVAALRVHEPRVVRRWIFTLDEYHLRRWVWQ
jgi:hypothetical protein